MPITTKMECTPAIRLNHFLPSDMHEYTVQALTLMSDPHCYDTVNLFVDATVPTDKNRAAWAMAVQLQGQDGFQYIGQTGGQLNSTTDMTT